MPRLSNELRRIEDMFRFWNETYYARALEEPVLSLIPDHRGRAYGWFTCYKPWKESKEKEGYYEINICADQLERTIEEITGTLLHEMAHLYNHMNGIQDTSRGGTYHNKKFKQTAEDHGLIIEQVPVIGWSKTKINDETKKIIKEKKFKPIRLKRSYQDSISPGKGNAKTKQSMRKYVCPCCGCIIRTTKEVHVLCIECDEEFQIES